VYNATVGSLSSILEVSNSANSKGNNKDTDSEKIYEVQCFPLYSVLLAVGRTDIDYFGLDVEGSEYKILQTIPWHKVYIKVI